MRGVGTIGAFVVSILVLATFGTVTIYIVTHEVPAANSAIANTMLGFLGAMATGVTSYWIGSTNGSRAKDAVIASAQEALANSMPVPPNTVALPPEDAAKP